MTGRTSFPLSRPVTVDGATYASFTLRNPGRRDLAATYYGTELGSAYRLLARLTGVPVAVIFALDPVDLGRASSEVYARLNRLAPRRTNANGTSHAG